MDIQSVLRDLTGEAGVSGTEAALFAVCEKYLAQYGSVRQDALGSVVCEIAGEKPGHILLDAHLDRIGLIVTAITEEGFLRIAACGGMDRRILNGQEVTVHGKKPLFGVIASTPPHLQSGGQERSATAFDEALVDVGLSKADAEQWIAPGDRITLNSDFLQLLGDRISCGALDDRAGIAVLLQTLEHLKDRAHPTLTIVFSAQEETGEAGARAAAFNAQADACIAVDVSFAKTPDSAAEKCGVIGKGPMIGIAPSLSFEMSAALQEIARKRGIPYQLEVMDGLTGTNADSMTVSRGGMQSGLISIPLRYMHTGVEVVSVRDIENCASLIAAYILGGASLC